MKTLKFAFEINWPLEGSEIDMQMFYGMGQPF